MEAGSSERRQRPAASAGMGVRAFCAPDAVPGRDLLLPFARRPEFRFSCFEFRPLDKRYNAAPGFSARQPSCLNADRYISSGFRQYWVLTF